MPSKPNLQKLAAENEGLRGRLEKAEESLREILSGEADALFVSGQGGAQLFALKGADQSYRTLIESMSEGALTLTQAGLILYANRRFAEMLGTSLEKVIGSDIHTWFAPESRQVLQTLLRNDAVDNRREELALVAADGTQVPVNLSVSHLILDEMPDSFCMVATDLTEQKRDEAILAAEKLARAILEQAADAIVICDETGRIIRASKQAQSLCGKNPVGQHFERAFPLRERDGTACAPIGAIDTNHRQSVEVGLECNGQGFDLLVSVGHLKSARNELLGSVVTLTDITARKREQAQRERLADLVEASPDFIGFADPKTARIQYINRHGRRMCGIGEDEDLGELRISDVHPAWMNKRMAEVILPAAVRNGLWEGEGAFLHRNGHETPVSMALLAHKTANGEVDLFYTVSRDITERKQAEKVLRESERRFSDLLGNVELVSVMRDREERITYCNEYLLHLTGWQKEEVIGRNWIELFLPPDIAEVKKAIFAALLLNDPEAWHHESEILTRSGERRLIRWNNSVLRSAAGDVVGTASIGEDITEQKRAEIRIKRMNRVYAVLSGINTLIVRVRDRDELFREACRIAVEDGGFRMTWIASIDRSVMEIVPVASVGVNSELLAAIKDRLSLSRGVPLEDNMVMRAVIGKKPVVSNDLQSDPSVDLGKNHADYGVRSIAILPLIVSDEVVGVLTLCAGESEFFHGDEMKLVTELAGDIAFAIDHIEKQERIDYLAYYDVLTGLANRTLFLERVAQSVRSATSDRHKLALFLADLERFKNINDSLGRPAGDALLRQVAQWLIRIAGNANLVARVGADVFAVMLPEVRQGGDLTRMLDKMMNAFLDHPFHLTDSIFRIAAKGGVALFPDDGADADTLFKNAEAALKEAKARGERYLLYTQTMTEAVAGKLTLENQLREALSKGEFLLHYQPKVNLASGKLTSAEALIRWNDPRTGLVAPGRFIPILEETGLIYDVGRWALRQVIADYLRWRAAGLPAVRIAVNVSPLQLRNRGFVAEIAQVIGIDAQAAEGLELEITESVIMEDIKHNIASLGAIRAMGVSIAIDDFGTGFSSLAYLAKLPVDTLKIDRSFVIDMTAGPEGLALVSTIINLAHSLKLKVVAEGVETEEQSRLLRLLSCDEMQGFLFSKPVPGDLFEARFLVTGCGT